MATLTETQRLKFLWHGNVLNNTCLILHVGTKLFFLIYSHLRTATPGWKEEVTRELGFMRGPCEEKEQKNRLLAASLRRRPIKMLKENFMKYRYAFCTAKPLHHSFKETYNKHITFQKYELEI